MPRDKKNLLDALDVMAVCLATGKKGDVVAVMRLPDHTLFIARNSAIDNKLKDHANTLIKALTRSARRIDVHDAVMPIVMKYCKENIVRRIKKLQGSFDNFKESKEQMASLDGQPSDPAALIKRILGNAASCLASRSSLETFEEEFRGVASAADSLLRTDHFTQLAAQASKMDDEEWRMIERLIRHLKKIIQFSHGIMSLIYYMEKEGSRDVGISWCGGWDEVDVLPVPSAADVIQTMKHGVGMKRVTEEFKGFDKRWGEGNNKISLHAELQIICHVHRQELSVRNLCHNMEQESSKQDMLIGVSKRACLSCFLYIDRYNQEFQKEWRTSGCHGKAYESWALPDMEGTCGADMIGDIKERLSGVLDKLTAYPGNSDDNATSQERDDSELEQELRALSERDAQPARRVMPVLREAVISFLDSSTKSSKLLPSCAPELQHRGTGSVIKTKKLQPLSRGAVAIVICGKGGGYCYSVEYSETATASFCNNKDTTLIASFDISANDIQTKTPMDICAMLKEHVTKAYNEKL